MSETTKTNYEQLALHPGYSSTLTSSTITNLRRHSHTNMSNNAYGALQHGGFVNSSHPQAPPSRPSEYRNEPLSRRSALPATNQSSPPTAELSENHAWVRLTVDLPGVLAKDLDVAIHHGILTVSGARQTLSVDGSVVLKKHKFSRRYAIDIDVVDISKVSANLSLGVLTIKAPKRTRLQDRVKVNVTEGDKPVQDVSGNLMVSTSSDGTTNSLAAIAPVGSSAVTTAAAEGSLESLGQSTLAAGDSGHGQQVSIDGSGNTAPQMVKPDEESDATAPSPDEDGFSKH